MREIKDTENRRPLPDAEADGIIEGRNAVIEALRTETAIDKIYIAKGETDKTLGHIASKARAAGIVVVDADLSPERRLQGTRVFYLHYRYSSRICRHRYGKRRRIVLGYSR